MLFSFQRFSIRRACCTVAYRLADSNRRVWSEEIFSQRVVHAALTGVYRNWLILPRMENGLFECWRELFL